MAEDPKSSNPQAFPIPRLLEAGMTLRDYFAAHAITAAATIYQERIQQPLFGRSPGTIQSIAFEVADAMLAEREKER